MLTNITCPGCGERIAVTSDPAQGEHIECGGTGEGACDACFDDANPEMLAQIQRAQSAAFQEFAADVLSIAEPDIISLLADAEERAADVGESMSRVASIPDGARMFVPVAPLLPHVLESFCYNHWTTIHQIWNARPRVYVAPK